jgi:cysteine desulfurase/selenocysteine lyase
MPWQILEHKTKVVLGYIGLTSNECLDMEQLKETLNERTKLVSTFHISNTHGCCLGKGYSGCMLECALHAN